MIRRIQPFLITAFFLVMMGLLARDHILPLFEEGERLRVDSKMVEDTWSVDRDDSMRLLLGTKVVGGLRITADKLSGDPTKYLFSMAGEVKTVFVQGTIHTTALANRRLELEQFTAKLDVPRLASFLRRGKATAWGEAAREPDPILVSGLVNGSNLMLKLQQGDSARYATQPLRGPITMMETVESALFAMMRQEGKVYRIETMDPFVDARAMQAFVEYEGATMVPASEITFRDLVPDNATELRVHDFRVSLGRMQSRYKVLDSGRVLARDIQIFATAVKAGQKSDGVPLFPELKMEIVEPFQLRAKYPALEHLSPSPELTVEEMTPPLNAEVIDLEALAPFLANAKSNSGATAPDQSSESP